MTKSITGRLRRQIKILFVREISAITPILWNLLATLANQGSTFVTAVALARMLDGRDFGIYVVVLSTAQIAALVAGAGMGYTATKYVAELCISNPTRASRIFGFCLAWSGVSAIVIAVLIIFGSPFLSSRVLTVENLAGPLRIAGCICFFMTINAVLTGALAGLGRFRLLALVGIGSGVTYIFTTTYLASTTGVAGAVLGLAISGAVQATLLIIGVLYARRSSSVWPDLFNSLHERPVLLRFTLPAAVAGLSTAGSLWVAQVVLTRQVGLVEVGLYSVASNLLTLTMLAPSVANTVGMSMLNKARGAGDPVRFERIYRFNMLITFAMVLLGAGLLAVCGKLILAGFGPGFVAAYPAVLLLLLAAFPEALGLARYQLLQSHERMWQAMKWVVVPRDLVLPLAALALVPFWGAKGLAAAYLLSRMLGYAGTRLATRRMAV
jgi:O-antigen/teichoic acid export membrane protein